MCQRQYAINKIHKECVLHTKLLYENVLQRNFATHTHTHIYIYIYICICICICICIYIYIYVYVYVYTYMYTHTHTHTHTYIYIYIYNKVASVGAISPKTRLPSNIKFLAITTLLYYSMCLLYYSMCVMSEKRPFAK
jgi:hypothetical protein